MQTMIFYLFDVGEPTLYDHCWYSYVYGSHERERDDVSLVDKFFS
ncbi:hypothetical protein LOT_1728 [Lentilactobacillus otakiensis DSM 19908 = JCM 15040]|uniref:Uncharacterized protein n=1 Tax=Lentilactobacillus otakiensis DSM 19908 = JCM 15040 TaxID=1423780 RepID=S4PQF9_9LACO|nr:hypothetical protein LOT_1728 [Lentilactobacillus otakiensis DSM 19908 = JCM 15040]